MCAKVNHFLLLCGQTAVRVNIIEQLLIIVYLWFAMYCHQTVNGLLAMHVIAVAASTPLSHVDVTVRDWLIVDSRR